MVYLIFNFRICLSFRVRGIYKHISKVSIFILSFAFVCYLSKINSYLLIHFVNKTNNNACVVKFTSFQIYLLTILPSTRQNWFLLSILVFETNHKVLILIKKREEKKGNIQFFFVPTNNVEQNKKIENFYLFKLLETARLYVICIWEEILKNMSFILHIITHSLFYSYKYST